MLIDTSTLVWAAAVPEKLSRRAVEALARADLDLVVSSVTAFEFTDLRRRGRFNTIASLQTLLRRFSAQVVAFPTEAWLLADDLPQIHFDPVDRMLVAHAMFAGLPLLSADADVAKYPVEVIW